MGLPEIVETDTEEITTEPDTLPDGAPAKRRGRPKGTVSATVPARVLKAIEEGMTANYTQLGFLMTLVPKPEIQAAGMAAAENAPKLGKAWADLARTNPAVAKYLMAMMTSSAAVTLIVAHAPIAFAFIAAKGQLPPGAEELAASMS